MTNDEVTILEKSNAKNVNKAIAHPPATQRAIDEGKTQYANAMTVRIVLCFLGAVIVIQAFLPLLPWFKKPDGYIDCTRECLVMIGSIVGYMFGASSGEKKSK